LGLTAINSLYTAGLSGGVAGGILISGLITIHHGWRTIYHMGIGLIGGTTMIMLFTMPETLFTRDAVLSTPSLVHHKSRLAAEKERDDMLHLETTNRDAEELFPEKKTYLQNLSLWNGRYTHESLLKLFLRPIGLLIVPQVLWATLVMSVLIGFLVAISSNFATAFSITYNFKPYQSGLCFISALLGSLIGIGFGGLFTDKIADFFTCRNGGIREPEMRLPAIFPSVICAPLALTLYGVGIQNKLHWMVPTFGLGLC
jgi:MFS family permease